MGAEKKLEAAVELSVQRISTCSQQRYEVSGVKVSTVVSKAKGSKQSKGR
jgi:hypothetical protein